MRAPRALVRSGILGEGRGAAGPPAVRGEPAAAPQVSGAEAEGPGGGLGAAASPAERGEAAAAPSGLLCRGLRCRGLRGDPRAARAPPHGPDLPGPAGTRLPRGRERPGAGEGTGMSLADFVPNPGRVTARSGAAARGRAGCPGRRVPTQGRRGRCRGGGGGGCPWQPRRQQPFSSLPALCSRRELSSISRSFYWLQHSSSFRLRQVIRASWLL